ncbi:MAG TPA: BTAD domain-containing putative transcriptional regulator [Kribbella sp.]|uniref:AfsR/SARP family transcriptional regulator n=1 Tax=Kribbella sp. TaxID=1871183 RepID=UPI002D775E1A|nr:BTAD domain-containing putative transcriptional regulator [Kribbella sp.]HET6294622.1 BTAD domain-containing putative transcriptional regulator [Kribbella sp.]
MNGHSAHTPARIAFRVLGPLEVEGPDGQPIDVCGGKPATMLTLLLLHRNVWVSTDQLIEAVWAGRDVPPSAQRNLKTYVWQLRRELPDERIESRPGAYRVRVLPGELDADIAADLSDEARKLLTAGSAAEAADLVERALGLWRGCPYDGLAGDSYSAVERLTELQRALREDLADAQLALGRSADAISLLRALTDEDPLRELAWTKLMSALRQTGRRHDALAAYQRARTLLVRDLGIEPGPELTAMHQQVLNDNAVLAPGRAGAGVLGGVKAEGVPSAAQAGAAQPTSGAMPAGGAGYSGLPARVVGFVGRAAEVERVRGAATAAGGVCVVTIDGMPGIGKTAFALEVAAALSDVPERQVYLDLRAHREGSVSVVDALGKLIRMVGLDGSLPSAIDELTSVWRALGQRILLVLDDAADAGQVRQLLPNAPGSVVLVTSRARLTGLDRTVAVSLDVLSATDAARLGASGEVEKWCAGHPGAIRHLVDRVRDRQPWTAARLTARLRDQPARCQELAEVHALFDSTYKALPEEVRRFYRLLSLIPQFDIRRAARLIGLDQQEVEPMLDRLLDQHLVTEPAPGRFALRPIVRDHAHTVLLATESSDALTAAAKRVRTSTGRAELELVAPKGPRVA